MKALLAILFKDLRIEFRTGSQALPFMSLSLILVTLFGLGVGSFITDHALREYLFHPIVWSIFLVTGSVTIMRIFESDREAHTVQALFLFGLSPLSYYFAKVLFLVLLLLGNQLLSSLLLSSLLRVPLISSFGGFSILTVLVSVGYAALGAFLGGFFVQYHQRYILFPLVFLPLLFPLFFAVLEVSFSIASGAGALAEGGWLSLIVALMTTYLVLGVLLFEVVVRE
jgi:ABC-type transport system involved in cytochrome c biogenesis permease component